MFTEDPMKCIVYMSVYFLNSEIIADLENVTLGHMGEGKEWRPYTSVECF